MIKETARHSAITCHLICINDLKSLSIFLRDIVEDGSLQSPHLSS